MWGCILAFGISFKLSISLARFQLKMGVRGMTEPSKETSPDHESAESPQPSNELIKSARAWNEWDGICKILTNAFVVATLVCTVNLLPRLLAGGPRLQDGLLAVVPAGLSLLFSKESLEKVSPVREDLRALLELLKIPKICHDEALLCSSFLFFLFMLFWNLRACDIANDRYNDAKKQIEKNLSSATKLAEAESNLKVAIALNPGHAEAHAELGWLYELRQDLSPAMSEYKLAMQSGSDIARIRLARLYLLDALGKDGQDVKKDDQSPAKASSEKAEKQSTQNGLDAEVMLKRPDIAASILMQDYKRLQDLPDDTLDRQLLKRSFYVALSWARMEQGRYTEATQVMYWAFEQHNKIKVESSKNHKEPEADDNIPSTIIYCINAELLDRQNKHSIAEGEWIKCRNSIGSIDIDEDQWLGRAYKRLKL